VAAFCDEVVKEKLGITWMCITRGDALNADLLSKMKAAGCVEIHIGVESGSQKVLDLMNKRTTVDTLVWAIGLIKGAGIRAKVYLMYGFPGEDDEDRRLTLEFVERTKPDGVTVSKFAPIPGSRLWNHGVLASEQWFYQDTDREYQEFRRKVHSVGGVFRR
jgi:radical SAM superfamily enzyme YgiQ (UPF0313 family)